jgi:hypothetical protein
MVLVDLGWEDADAILREMGREDVEVRLVLGAGPDDPGVRVAGLLGVPHSTDLVDLTRELFDVAVIGAASPRRAALERLLASLGTEILEDSPTGARDDAGPSGLHAPPDSLVAIGAEAGHALDAALGVDFGVAGHEAAAARADELNQRVARAVERHRQEGTPFALHRVTLDTTAEQADALAATLPGLFRDGDYLCRTETATWVLLCSGPAPVDVLGRRVRRAWRRTHASGRPPVARRERVPLTGQADAVAFAAAARDWKDVTGGRAGHGGAGARAR